MKKTVALVLFFCLSVVVSLMAGSVFVSPAEFFKGGELARVILNLRISRTVLGIVSGGMLAACGVFLQGLLNNPLVEPYTLGTASGAAFGAAFSILVFHFISPVYSFFGSIITIITVYFFSRIEGRLIRERLILSGVVLSFLCSSLVMILMVLGGRELNEIIYLLMGNLGIVLTAERLMYYLFLLILLFAIYIALYFHSWDLDIVSSGAETAKTLGVNTERLMVVVFVLVSLIVAIVVSVVGAIGFVGLVIPHIARRIFGSAHRRVALASFFLGASFLLLADSIARMITPIELPVGVVTSLAGVPFFLFLQARRR